MQGLTEKIDELFAQNRGKEAEALLEETLKELLQEGRLGEAVPVINELIGYCRETSQVEKSYEYADLVLMILDRLQLQGTIPYATTLLNIANAYRAGGRLEDSLNVYEQVEEIYRQKLDRDDMLFANLHNNISLLHQEMGRFDLAKDALLRALAIVEKKPDAVFEVAVTYANLASTCLSLGQDEEAQESFRKSIAMFEENQIFDTHYCAALSALATFHYKKGSYEQAEGLFLKAMKGIETHLGQNEYYHRMKENAAVCRKAYEASKVQNGIKQQRFIKGMDICKAYYETYGKPMIEKLFPEYVDKIAVGLVGEGSDCFGYDDEFSRDHDWGPGFCMWVTEETYAKIGRPLQEAYEALPKEFQGYKFQASVQGKGRRGVHTISWFYRTLLGLERFPEDMGKECFTNQVSWEKIEDASLAAAVNGQVFTDPEGIFSKIRQLLKEAYPDRLRYLKLAEGVARFCQNGQYNLPRVLKREDPATAGILRGEAVKEGLKLLYHMDKTYPPHEKWLFYGLKDKEKFQGIVTLLKNAMVTDIENGEAYLQQAAEKMAGLLYQENYISDTDSYLDAHVGELLFKAGIADLDEEALAEKIARLEFEAFDKVKNLGGRADCQDDWFTFSIMRKSQYLTWTKNMLMQYYYDFSREYERGHNLIEEKYGRMMESTAPTEYAAMKDHFPVVSVQKKRIIEAIVEMQVAWMEEFAGKYPLLAGNARSIHTYEDTPWNTSYETYLRGEISTYSDKMLELYGRYIVEFSVSGKNPAKEIMKHSVLMYGYEGLEDAEKGLK